MKKLNCQGFALVETLIVTTFVLGIVTLILTNYLPMMGTYEKKEYYDDIDSVYNTYLIKKMLENSASKSNVASLKNGLSSTSSKINPVNCDIYNNTDYLDYCQNLFENMGVYSIIVAPYKLTYLKKDVSSLNKNFQEYILSLPNYNNNPNGYSYRVLVQYKHGVNKELGNNTESTYYSYSTIGVDL